MLPILLAWQAHCSWCLVWFSSWWKIKPRNAELASVRSTDTLSCRTCRRTIERALWVIWIELGFSGEFCDVGLSCITYTRKPGLSVRDRFFENFWKSKYRLKLLICFLGTPHWRVSLEKLWAIRKNWSCPEILDGYRLAQSRGWPLNRGLTVSLYRVMRRTTLPTLMKEPVQYNIKWF